MVSAEELGSAYTLAGLQMDVSGIIGPLLSSLLLPLAGVSFIFGANGLGFILMFLAILQWKRPKAQSSLPLENFFESLTTAIRYVRYTPGIKILLARHGLFSFFISIIPSLMPVVGLRELRLQASELGYLFTAMAVGSVISGSFISLFSHSLDSGRIPAPKDGPVSITAEYNIDPTRRDEFLELMRDARLIILRNGAQRWHLYEDLSHPNKFRMEVVVPSWKQHLYESERMTKNEKDVLLNLRALRIDPNPSEQWVYLSVEKEVLNKRVRAGGLSPGYIDQQALRKGRLDDL